MTLLPHLREAVFHVLKSRDRITGIAGKAGTGKTTLLKEAAQGMDVRGQKLLVLAPTAETARGVLRKEGFQNAETVAQLLVSPKLQESSRGAVWWVDEAGLLSSRTMDRLLDLSEKLEARVVLVGDSGQHHSVERGSPFDLLAKFGGMSVAGVDKIQRQQGAYREAVGLIADRKYNAALDMFAGMGAFHEIEDTRERHRAIASDYVAAVELGKTALVVSPTRETEVRGAPGEHSRSALLPAQGRLVAPGEREGSRGDRGCEGRWKADRQPADRNLGAGVVGAKEMAFRHHEELFDAARERLKSRIIIGD